MGIIKRKGMSLIVLVITIIVMIILATAIILSLTNSGIIGKANKAKRENDISSAKEIISVAYSEWILMSEEEQISNGGSFVTYASDKLEKTGIDSEDYIIKETGEVEVCVAKIGEVRFSDLQDAIDESEEGQSISIMIVNNVELTKTVYISSEQYAVIDLNGYMITSVGNTIRNNGMLVIKDSSINKTGIIKAVYDSSIPYEEKYDLNNDGVIGQADYDKISEYFGVTIDDTTSDEIKKCDVNEDGGIDISDFTTLPEHVNDAYAIFNSSTGILTIKGMSKDKFSGEPIAIYNKDGTVEGYNF